MVSGNCGREEGALVGQAPHGPDLLQLHWLVCMLQAAYPHGQITTPAAEVH